MPQITTVTIATRIKRPSFIEYPTTKTALASVNKGQGRWIVCNLRTRSFPTSYHTV
jgi:hypothetical protein